MQANPAKIARPPKDLTHSSYTRLVRCRSLDSRSEFGLEDSVCLCTAAGGKPT